MKKLCNVCGREINTKEQPYFKIGAKYICDDTINVGCCVTFLSWHRKNEDKTE